MRTSRFQGLRRPLTVKTRPLPSTRPIDPITAAKNDAFAERARERFALIDSWPPRLRRFVNVRPRAMGFSADVVDGLYRQYLADYDGDVAEAVEATLAHMKRTMASRRVLEELPEKRTSF